MSYSDNQYMIQPRLSRPRGPMEVRRSETDLMALLALILMEL